jgi:PAS domain S-box-containing protein
MTMRHRLLRRQVAAHLGPESEWSAPLHDFVAAVNDTYLQSDADRTRLWLEHSVSVLQATLESTADGILVVDAHGRISSFNRKFLDLWSIPEAVLSTRDDDAALAFIRDQVVDPEGFLRKVRALYEHPDEESHDEIELKDGRVFERYSMPQRLGGVAVARVWSFRDITPRLRAERALRDRDEQLRQAQKMEAVGLLAGGIAHDFNNLLTAIAGYSGLLLEEMPPDHPLRDDVVEIQKAGESASSLTRQLLAFSRRQILKPQILDLNAVVTRVETLLRRLIGENITLESRLARSLQRVNLDPGQVEQIIVNLAVNARDAMRRGGHLTLETADVVLHETDRRLHHEPQPGEYVMLAVGDSGTGISDDVLSHIFEPFFTTKPRGEGTGLGLATVYGIVKQSNGGIRVESEVGRGTTFRIYFPSVGQHREARLAVAAAEIVGGTETILLAEDQPEVRAVTRAMLVRHGYTVLVADSGRRALEIARGHDGRIDLLLTDVVMPLMSGPELAAQLKVLLPSVRVIFSSGYTEEASARHGIMQPQIAFLQKPFSSMTLLATVRDVLDAGRESSSRPTAFEDSTYAPGAR